MKEWFMADKLAVAANSVADYQRFGLSRNDRTLGGRGTNRHRGGHLRMVVLRRAPGGRGEAGRGVHEQGHRRATKTVGPIATTEPRASGRAPIRKARPLSRESVVGRKGPYRREARSQPIHR